MHWTRDGKNASARARRFYRVTAVLVVSLACAAAVAAGQHPEVRVEEFLSEEIGARPGTLFRASLSPDGQELYYFVKVDPDAEDYRIFMLRRQERGWSEPELLALGDPDASNLYPVVSPDGRLLVFASYREVTPGVRNANLWVAHRAGDGWGPPRLLDRASVVENYDASPWFGPAGDLHFTSTSPDWTETSFRVARRQGDDFGEWELDRSWEGLEIPHQTHHLWNVTLDPSGTVAVLELAAKEADGTTSHSDLWIATRRGERWTRPEPLPGVNSNRTENFAIFAATGELLLVRDFSTILRVEFSF